MIVSCNFIRFYKWFQLCIVKCFNGLNLFFVDFFINFLFKLRDNLPKQLCYISVNFKR